MPGPGRPGGFGGPGGHHRGPGGPGFGGHPRRPPMPPHHPHMGGGWHHPYRNRGCCGCLFPVIGVIGAVIATFSLIF